jgi:hypothetical protein
MRIVDYNDLVIGTLYYIEMVGNPPKRKHKGFFIGYDDGARPGALFKNVEKMPGTSSHHLPDNMTIPTFEMNERPLINGRRSTIHDMPYSPWKHTRGHWTYYLPEIEEIEQNRLTRLYEDATNSRLREITGDPSFFYFKRTRTKGGKTKRKRNSRRNKNARSRLSRKSMRN